MKTIEILQRWLQESNTANPQWVERGCTLILQYLHNHVLAANFRRVPKHFLPAVQHHLSRALTLALQEVTHTEVIQMKKQVQIIVATLPAKHPAKEPAKEPASVQPTRGRRPDHDTLPAEIRDLYEQNLPLLQRIRNLHERLIILTEQQRQNPDISCPDGEIYPFLKEIIALEKKYHQNWKTYDEYQPE